MTFLKSRFSVHFVLQRTTLSSSYYTNIWENHDLKNVIISHDLHLQLKEYCRPLYLYDAMIATPCFNRPSFLLVLYNKEIMLRLQGATIVLLHEIIE